LKVLKDETGNRIHLFQNWQIILIEQGHQLKRCLFLASCSKKEAISKKN